MEKVKYQIFVSSTYTDLVEERDQIIKACLEMGHIPVGMEMFSAADEEQWRIITRQIDESDYYVVVVANRYGEMVSGISYTEKEYDYAIEKGIPTLGFVLDSQAAWPNNRQENSEEARTKLESFKQKVKLKPVNFWSTKDDLHAKCAIALMKTFNTQPRPGWVRSSETTGPAVASELSRLSSENAKLREELATLKEFSIAEGFAHGEDTIELHFNVNFSYAFKTQIGASWNEIFIVSARTMLESPQQNLVVNGINFHFREQALTKAFSSVVSHFMGSTVSEESYHRSATVRLSEEDVEIIRTQFLALGLIKISHIDTGTGNMPVWNLTSTGQRQYINVTAIKKQTGSFLN